MTPAVAGERGALYLLLARVFAREPDAPFLERLESSGLRAEMARRGFEWEGDIEALAIEYTRLFVGPGPHAAPYGSVHSEKTGDGGRLWGDSTVEVKRLIEASGLTFASDYGGIPDHLAVELEFLGRLAEAERRASAEGESAKAATLRSLQGKFLRDCVQIWFPAFVAKVTAMNPRPFYAGFVAFCRDWLASEDKTLA